MDNTSGEKISHEGNESEIALPEIDRKLLQLRQFETDLQNNEVTEAITALRRVFDLQFERLTSLNIVITYHGSLQYNDPLNLDADVEFMGDNLKFEDVKDKFLEAERELRKPDVWPRKTCDTNFGVCSIGEIRERLKEFDGKKHYDPNPKEDYDFDPALDASLILSSKVLYENQKPQLEYLQGEVRKLIAGSQWLREGVLHKLNSVIGVRQERRRTT